ncbi:YheC/YheD family protein [Paenibacillus plantarum]|nr:YheC/YheD family protein [Paenibacillus plantarum]
MHSLHRNWKINHVNKKKIPTTSKTSKWSKHKLLSQSASTRPHLPETRWLTASSFWLMIAKYGEVIIKPTSSSGGHGVIRIKHIGMATYEIHDGARKSKLTKLQTNQFISKKLSRSHIVQKRIALATVNGKPFDLRVMVQRRPNSHWQVTGKLAKVAGKGFIVTNTAKSHGYVITVNKAIELSNLPTLKTTELLRKLDQVALHGAAKLGPSYRWVNTFGFDMALDTKGRVWIIEVNLAPMLELFLKLKDKSTFRKIKAIHMSRKI